MRHRSHARNGGERMSKADEVYNVVIERLTTARYAFGDRLLVKELGAETGASRQPIMAARNRLSAEGFVQIIPQGGCQVIDPAKNEISDFFQMFQRMEGLLAELAARRRTEDDLHILRRTQQRLRDLDRTSENASRDYTLLNQEFHQAMHRAAHSPLLDEKQRKNFLMIDFFITHSVGFGAFMDDAVREHDQIIDAIEKRQTERARLEAESHIAAIASSVLGGLEIEG